jgi:branched-chain amino acid transport system substrate-binding protein
MNTETLALNRFAALANKSAKPACVRWLGVLVSVGFLVWPQIQASGLPPVHIGFEGEYTQLNSTSAQAIELGTRIAIDEINASGGVLGGRLLNLVTQDNHGISARALDNFRVLAQMPDLVAIYGGKFSPLTLSTMPLTNEMGIISVSLWGSADPITENPLAYPFVYRLSLKDSWAIPAMMRHARTVFAATKLCVVLPNTAWGRSGESAVKKTLAQTAQTVVHERWYHLGERGFESTLKACATAGAQALLMIANEGEGAALVNAMTNLPLDWRMPIVAHWGITGGAFHSLVAQSARAVRLDIIQTFSFVDNPRPVAQSLAQVAMQRTGAAEPGLIPSPVGVAQAYDMTHLLALAINKAGSTNRVAVQQSLQMIGPFEGAIRRYEQPFTDSDHDGLTESQVMFVYMRPDGALIPA